MNEDEALDQAVRDRQVRRATVGRRLTVASWVCVAVWVIAVGSMPGGGGFDMPGVFVGCVMAGLGIGSAIAAIRRRPDNVLWAYVSLIFLISMSLIAIALVASKGMLPDVGRYWRGLLRV